MVCEGHQLYSTLAEVDVKNFPFRCAAHHHLPMVSAVCKGMWGREGLQRPKILKLSILTSWHSVRQSDRVLRTRCIHLSFLCACDSC